jgi:hypothetical protein
MKHLLGLALLSILFLLMPTDAVGQVVYTFCDVFYDEPTDTVQAYTTMSNAYEVSFYYTPLVHLTLDANYQRVADIGAGYQNGSIMAYASVPAQPETEYMVNGYSSIITYFYYLYYPEIMSYDPFDFQFWGANCDNFIQSVSCIGYGPPIYLAGFVELAVGAVWKSIQTPPAQPPGGTCPVQEGSRAWEWREDYIDGYYQVGASFQAQLVDSGGFPPAGKYAGRTITESFADLYDGCYANYGGIQPLGQPYQTTLGPVDGDNRYLDYLESPREWIDHYVGMWAACFASLTQTVSLSGCVDDIESHGCYRQIDAVPPRHTYGVNRDGANAMVDW